MRVKDLIEELQLLDQNAMIVINNELVTMIRLESGRDKIGYMKDYWSPLKQGNRNAVRFSYLVELSDGSIEERFY